MQDTLVKAVAGDVRGYAAVTTDLVNEGILRHKCLPLAAAALGRTMTGALLLAANLKNKEALTLKIKGNGPLGSVVADATPEGAVRGYCAGTQAFLPLKPDGKLDVGKGIGGGYISITRFTGLKEPVTGSADLVTGEIAEDITNYLFTSEQTPSSVGLGVLIGADGKAESAGGFLLQPMPGSADTDIDRLEENLKNAPSPSEMVKQGYRPQDILSALLNGIGEIKFLSETKLAFRCGCSKRRIEDVLMALREEELASLEAEGKAEVTCHFCGEKYRFGKEELTALLAVSRKLRGTHG